MTRGTTIGELRWPDTPDFMKLAREWRADATEVMASIVWTAYELLVQEVFSEIDLTLADEQLERSITQYLAKRIDRVMSGDEPFEVQHGPYEFATAQTKKAQPPLYDIAFCLLANERVMWPLEAKIIRSDGGVAPYISEVTDQFLECRYAPFSSEGGMLAYMLAGDAEKFFTNIADGLKAILLVVNSVPPRSHRISYHKRTNTDEEMSPREFRCHHFALKFFDLP